MAVTEAEATGKALACSFRAALGDRSGMVAGLVEARNFKTASATETAATYERGMPRELQARRRKCKKCRVDSFLPSARLGDFKFNVQRLLWIFWIRWASARRSSQPLAMSRTEPRGCAAVLSPSNVKSLADDARMMPTLALLSRRCLHWSRERLKVSRSERPVQRPDGGAGVAKPCAPRACAAGKQAAEAPPWRAAARAIAAMMT